MAARTTELSCFSGTAIRPPDADRPLAESIWSPVEVTVTLLIPGLDANVSLGTGADARLLDWNWRGSFSKSSFGSTPPSRSSLSRSPLRLLRLLAAAANLSRELTRDRVVLGQGAATAVRGPRRSAE